MTDAEAAALRERVICAQDAAPVIDGPKQYLGFTDGDLVRDQRSGLAGRVRVRVRDDEEVGRYAEVVWDGSFVSDQLEVAIDNGLDRAAGSSGNVLEVELDGPGLDDAEVELDGSIQSRSQIRPT